MSCLLVVIVACHRGEQILVSSKIMLASNITANESVYFNIRVGVGSVW